jgi:excisionase family DNA binding protein
MTQFRISDAAELLGVSVDTVRRWANNGRLQAARDEHGHRIIDGQDLAAARSGSAASSSRTSATLPQRMALVSCPAKSRVTR